MGKTDFLNAIQQLDEKKVLTYFAELSAVPRGSFNNKGISDYLVQFGKKNKLEVRQDEALNVIFSKPASKGYEQVPGVIIQGHMDMVCVKTEESDHDFEREGLELFLEGDFIGAKGTTLGADNGIAIALGLALLNDETLLHPALELIVTTDEEVGLDGAKALDGSLIKGRRMINLDSEGEGIVLCSCAGGLRVTGTIPIGRISVEGEEILISIGGLLGGHSGVDILENRINATLLLARLLFELKENHEFLLVEMQGGEKDNAIPSFAKAKVLVKKEESTTFLDALQLHANSLKKEFAAAEPSLAITATKGEVQNRKALHPNSFEKMLFAFIQAPNGVQTMSAGIKNLAETSLNLGVFRLEEEKAVYFYSIRSSCESAKYFIKNKLYYLFDFLGGERESSSEYPAWEYKEKSALRELFRDVYLELYHEEPHFEAIHAGLECGILSEKIPELDIIAMGPNLYDIHTPKERMSVSSVLRTLCLLQKLLSSMEYKV